MTYLIPEILTKWTTFINNLLILLDKAEFVAEVITTLDNGNA